jgi:poly-gamma-glutamate synthesis protein (capsule biosynthesis protein)
VRDYPLTVWFGYSGSPAALDLLNSRLGPQGSLLPASNRDTSKMTVLAMTGVTALARATASRMDSHGVTYPGLDIAEWLRSADLTHISNEVSFNPDCPLANPMSTSMQFCSRPEYIGLLDYIGADIIELSGNHNNDYGREASTYSLDLYAQRGWLVYAGGANQEEARQPRTIEHNGNRFAFIGCNPVGPANDLATDTEPGAAVCDYEYMTEQIRRLRADGYLPIVTIQYNEYYIPYPSETQERDFRLMSDAGAVIVSGSQAHFPQSMEFYGGGFIHYGLGNLFFDQMDVPVVGTRREFVDRHVFYEGRYISTELKTAMLEDYARPRPMTEEERRQFLTDIFTAGGW